ncbi:ankyrin repeat domain-containing protein [Pontiellaceae bacterium B1224]|nr:ankyrin repeat domain-containing protein [Pontiellaceae bacterium B1224]
MNQSVKLIVESGVLFLLAALLTACASSSDAMEANPTIPPEFEKELLDEDGEVSLKNAIVYDLPSYVSAAIDRKGTANVLVDVERGRTALHLACLLGHETSVRILLSRGADPGIRDGFGCLPISIARDQYHEMTECSSDISMEVVHYKNILKMLAIPEVPLEPRTVEVESAVALEVFIQFLTAIHDRFAESERIYYLKVNGKDPSTQMLATLRKTGFRVLPSSSGQYSAENIEVCLMMKWTSDLDADIEISIPDLQWTGTCTYAYGYWMFDGIDSIHADRF